MCLKQPAAHWLPWPVQSWEQAYARNAVLGAGSIWQWFPHLENLLSPILLLDIFMSGCNARTATIFSQDEESGLRTKTNTLDGKVEIVQEADP